jgi:hypothetical protein
MVQTGTTRSTRRTSCRSDPFFQQKSHMDWRVMEPGSPRWEVEHTEWIEWILMAIGLDSLILDVLVWNNKSCERNYRFAIFYRTKSPVKGIPYFILASEQAGLYNYYKMHIFSELRNNWIEVIKYICTLIRSCTEDIRLSHQTLLNILPHLSQ